jgi:hypothetical protein
MPEHGAVAAKRGHDSGEQPVFSFSKLRFLHLSVRTKSAVEIHERSVLRQFELLLLLLCRDESEARGDEEREHRCGLSVECQTAVHANESAMQILATRKKLKR